MISVGREREGSRRKSGESIAKNGGWLAALQAIGEMAGGEFSEAGESVGDAFNRAKPRRACANGREKRGQHSGGGFVAPVAEQACEADAENGAVAPGLFGRGILHVWDAKVVRLFLGGTVEDDANLFQGDEAAVDHFVETGKNLFDALGRLNDFEDDRQILGEAQKLV